MPFDLQSSDYYRSDRIISTRVLSTPHRDVYERKLLSMMPPGVYRVLRRVHDRPNRPLDPRTEILNECRECLMRNRLFRLTDHHQLHTAAAAAALKGSHILRCAFDLRTHAREQKQPLEINA